MTLTGIIDGASLKLSNNEWYDAYLLQIDDNGVQSNPNIFREYESVLPHKLVEDNPEDYLNYKGSLLLPWQEEDLRNSKGGGSSDKELDELRTEVADLKILVEKQSKLLEELTNKK